MPVEFECCVCGSTRVHPSHSRGGVEEGTFKETYRCHDCGKHGWIRGDSGDDPDEWERFGKVFGNRKDHT